VLFRSLVQDSHRIKQMPEIMAASAECRTINAPRKETSETQAISVLYGKMKNDRLMIKPKYEHPIILQGNLLLHAHVLRLTDMLTPTLRKDLEQMLSKSPDLVEGIIEISYHRRWLETTIAAINFSQCLVQGLWHTNSPFEQLPHIHETEAKALLKAFFGTSPVGTLTDFLKASEDEKKKCLTMLSEEQKVDVFKACKIFPCLQIDTKLFVEEDDEKGFFDDDEDSKASKSKTKAEEAPAAADALVTSSSVGDGAYANAVITSGDKIFEQDLVTLRVTMTRLNVTAVTGKGAVCKAPSVYAPLFPRTIYENWWLILTDKALTSDGKKKLLGAGAGSAVETNIHAVEKISDQGRVISHELRFMAPQRAGTYEMQLHILSDCYMGLDNTIDITFDVSPASELPEVKLHPEDLELDNEPTLFEQLLVANAEDESSDDDDEEDEVAAGAGKGNSNSGGMKVTTKKGSSSPFVVEDVDEESEDEDE